MAMERWDPFRDMVSLRDAMDRLIQDSFVRPAGSIFSGSRGSIPVDVLERDDSYELHASMPGIKPEDMQVTVQGNAVIIQGQSSTQEEQKDEKQNWVVKERRTGSFYRSISLPSGVDPDLVTARYEHGELVLTLPKIASGQARHIPVDSSSGQPNQIGSSAGANTAANQRNMSDTPMSGQSSQGGSTYTTRETYTADDASTWNQGQGSESNQRPQQ